MIEWAQVLAGVASGSVAGAATSLWMTKRKILWEGKRDACMRALNVVNRHFSHLSWSTGVATPQERPSIAEIRHCHNLLATTCKSPAVVVAYLECFGFNGEPFDASEISRLRSAVRKELGTRKRLTERPDLSFIAAVDTTKEVHDANRPGPNTM